MSSSGSKLNGDCLFYLSRFVLDLKDIVRLWIANGAPTSSRHIMWRKLLREFLLARDGQQLEAVIMRLGCRLDSYGLLLVERMHVDRKCNRSGCFQPFREINNSHTACHYHKGFMRKGKLSCCQQLSFRESGCTQGFHDGSLHEHLFMAREKLMPPEGEVGKEENIGGGAGGTSGAKGVDGDVRRDGTGNSSLSVSAGGNAEAKQCKHMDRNESKQHRRRESKE